MNKLRMDERAQIVTALVEGNSILAVSKRTGKARNTINKLLLDLGAACSAHQDKVFRNLKLTRIQCNEIWTFVGFKQQNVTNGNRGEGYGDVWTWSALDMSTKLVPCWYVGTREDGGAYNFIHDLKSRLANRVEVPTDGHKAYAEGMDVAYGKDIDYAIFQTVPAKAPEDEEAHDNLVHCISVSKAVIRGMPDSQHYSKMVQNHKAALALHFMHYNFARIHQTLRITPTMASGISDHVWSLNEIVSLLDSN